MNGRKTLVAVVGIIIALVVVVGVYFLVQQQTEQLTPSPTPAPVLSPSPATPGIFEVTENACSTTFTVTGEPGLFCDGKEAYFDDPLNEEDNYTLTTPYTSGDLVEVDDVIVYVINYVNSGGAGIGGTLTDVLPDGLEFVDLEFVDADVQCIYTSATRTFSCDLDFIEAGESGQRAYRARVLDSAIGTILSNTASVTPTGGSTSTCSFNLEVPEGSASPSPSPSPSPSGSPTPTPSGSPTPTPPGSPTPTPSGSPPPSQLPEAGIMTFTTGTIGAGALLILLGLLGVLLF